MYTHPLFIVLSLAFVTLAPVLYVSSHQKRKNKKRLQKLTELAQEHHLTLEITESLPLLLMGLATGAHKFLVVDVKNDDRTRILDLRNYLSCEILTVRSKSGGIDRISLLLKPNRKDFKEELILIYDENLEVHPNATVRMKTAERWKSLLSEKLN